MSSKTPETFEEFASKTFTCRPDGTSKTALCNHAKDYLSLAHTVLLEAAKREAYEQGQGDAIKKYANLNYEEGKATGKREARSRGFLEASEVLEETLLNGTREDGIKHAREMQARVKKMEAA